MDVQKLKNLDSLFQQEIKAERLKGCSIKILHKGQSVYEGCFGSDTMESVYRIFSMTKPITAVAVLMLVERGLLDQNEPVSKFIPEFAGMKVATPEGEVPAKNEITIAHCLNMTSGLVYPGLDSVSAIRLGKEAERISVRQEFGESLDGLSVAKAIANIPLLFEPGTAWNYSVSGDVLSAVVELVTGVRYGEFLRRAIFEPLGMKDTAYVSGLGEREERLAEIYTRLPDGRVVPASKQQIEIATNGFVSTKSTSFDGGGSGLCSTLADYSQFALMLLGEGELDGVRILGRKTAELLHTDCLPENVRRTINFNNIKGYSYSNLVRIMKDTGEALSNGSVGEYGWDGMLGTYFMVDPKEELVMVYGQQILEGLDEILMRKIRSILYGAL
ncbi:MAG: serine hydrolase [Lachnospiraceae bacterium]|nr:serine hydrolase [Lachnospiraceae bacterium]